MSANEATLGFKIKVDGDAGVAGVAQFRQKVGTELNVIQGNFGKAGSAIKKEMGDVAQSLANNTGALGRMASSFGTAGLAMGAAAGAAVGIGAALFQVAKSAADAGSKFHDLSLKTGVSVETLSGLELQLKQSGADMDKLANAAVFMQKNLAEAASGNRELQKTFAALGVKDVRAALADTDGTLKTVIKSLGAMESAGERNAAGSKVMGRGFKELSVFLADTKGDLEGVISESERAGRVMSTQAAAAADAFSDQLDALQNAASVAARSFGMELVPVITEGMSDMTGALQGNSNQWRAWGASVADVLRGIRELADSQLGSVIGQLGRLVAMFPGLHTLLSQTGRIGAEARAADPAAAIKSSTAASASASLDLLRANLTPEKPKTSDLFNPGAGVKKAATEAEKARQQFIETLHDWADAFNIPRKALREVGSQSKVHKGWAHRAGMATDIDPRFMTPDAIEGAKRLGLNVIPELYTGQGPNGYSTGPHYHIQAMSKAKKVAVEIASKAVEEATEKENKAWAEQEAILDKLAQAIAEANLEQKALTRSSVESRIAAEYQELGIGKLTGAAAELGEVLFAERMEQIKAADAAERHAQAIKNLIELAERQVEIDPKALVGADTQFPQAAGPGGKVLEGPWVDPAQFEPPPPPNFDPWKQAITGVRDLATGAFGQVGKAMGAAAAASLAYGQSFGKAMKQAMAAALISIAAESFVRAIFETAKGVAALAGFNPGSAALHFKAAGLFALVGAAAGVGGALFSGGGASGTGGASAFGGSPAAGAGAFGTASQDDGPRVIEQSRNTVQQQVIILRVESNDSHIVSVLQKDVRANGPTRQLIVETAAA